MENLFLVAWNIEFIYFDYIVKVGAPFLIKLIHQNVVEVLNRPNFLYVALLR